MLSILLLVIIACSCVNCTPFFQYQSQYVCPSSQNQGSNAAPLDLATLTQGLPLPPNKPQNLVPVALDSNVSIATTFPPLKISVKKNAQLYSKNDGFLTYSLPYGEDVVATLTGGPADSEYVFCLLAQNQVPPLKNARASTTEDGVGFPAQVQMFFRKLSYGSFKNCLEKSDGIILFPFDIVVEGSVPNESAQSYCNLLNRLARPNSTSTISAYDAFDWLLSSLEFGYYVHPSSYIDIYSLREYPCATNIQPNFAKHPFVSYAQYVAFTNLLNKNYQPEDNVLALYPLAGRQVLQANSPVSYNYYD